MDAADAIILDRVSVILAQVGDADARRSSVCRDDTPLRIVADGVVREGGAAALDADPVERIRFYDRTIYDSAGGLKKDDATATCLLHVAVEHADKPGSQAVDPVQTACHGERFDRNAGAGDTTPDREVRMKILIVDDHVLIRDAVRRVLTQMKRGFPYHPYPARVHFSSCLAALRRGSKHRGSNIMAHK
jgi:hypothetical protein